MRSGGSGRHCLRLPFWWRSPNVSETPETPCAPLSFALLLTTPAAAAPCGGDFGDFLKTMEAEVIAAGVPAETAAAFFEGRAPGPEGPQGRPQPGRLPQDLPRLLAIADLEAAPVHRPRPNPKRWTPSSPAPKPNTAFRAASCWPSGPSRPISARSRAISTPATPFSPLPMTAADPSFSSPRSLPPRSFTHMDDFDPGHHRRLGGRNRHGPDAAQGHPGTRGRWRWRRADPAENLAGGRDPVRCADAATSRLARG